jgi:hypothetical protein
MLNDRLSSVEYVELRKLIAIRRIIGRATPIDLGLSVAVAIVIAVTAWGSTGQGPHQTITVTTAVQA